MNLRTLLIPPTGILLCLGLTGCPQKDAPTPPKNDTPAAKPTEAMVPGSAAQAPAEPPPIPGALPAPADVAAPPADAVKSPSGLASKVLKPGTGKDHPAATDQVTVNYTGWTSKTGRMFDSSVVRKRPATFPLNGVIKGWTEGVQLMVEGEKTRFWIPAALAYGDNPGGGAPAGMLVFDVELYKIVK